MDVQPGCSIPVLLTGIVAVIIVAVAVPGVHWDRDRWVMAASTDGQAVAGSYLQWGG